MAHDVDVGLTRQRDLDEARIEIRRRHVPCRPHPLAQPAGDRPATSTNLQASPHGSDADRRQVANVPGSSSSSTTSSRRCCRAPALSNPQLAVSTDFTADLLSPWAPQPSRAPGGQTSSLAIGSTSRTAGSPSGREARAERRWSAGLMATGRGARVQRRPAELGHRLRGRGGKPVRLKPAALAAYSESGSVSGRCVGLPCGALPSGAPFLRERRPFLFRALFL